MKDIYGFFFFFLAIGMISLASFCAGAWLIGHNNLTVAGSSYLIGKIIGMFIGAVFSAVLSVKNFKGDYHEEQKN